MMLDSKWVRRAGILVLAIILVGFWVVEIAAIRAGGVWMFVSHRGSEFDTYSFGVLLALFTVVSAILAVRHWR